MKKDYTNPTVSIIRYETPDVILVSSTSVGAEGGLVDLTGASVGKLNTSWLHK